MQVQHVCMLCSVLRPSNSLFDLQFEGRCPLLNAPPSVGQPSVGGEFKQGAARCAPAAFSACRALQHARLHCARHALSALPR